jgi:asparagine synthase (glutamine-hydrolysing)
MCGIAGALTTADPDLTRARADRMTQAMAHRGPDGFGLARSGGATIGMCRLRIRSAPNAQVPFELPHGMRAAFNGEIYMANGGPPSGGAGEVAGIVQGPPDATDGMFALALLNADGGVRLMRDRFGIKPLFLRMEDGTTSFASELPALLDVGGPVEIDGSALYELLAFGRTLDRRTLYRGVCELPPGADLMVAPDGTLCANEAHQATVPETDPADARAIRASVREALERTIVSDRPLGLALSGGLDSTILAYELKALGVRNLRTVSLSLPDNRDGISRLSELGFGEDLTRAGWHHVVQPIDEAGYIADLSEAARRMGEPFRMSSLPLYFTLGEATAAAQATVLLLGEGADELFGGYESYCSVDMSLSRPATTAIRDFYLGGTSGAYLTRLIGAARAADLGLRLEAMVAPLTIGRSPKQALLAVERRLSLEPLLRRADHALMAAGVEGRTPFLHGRIPVLAESLSDADLWSKGETKAALRRAYRGILPPACAAVPKRALRAPGRLWREQGVIAIDRLASRGMPLFSALDLAEDGIAAVRDGCAAGDPTAIPFAVALISTAACLVRLAETDRLADPLLARAAFEARAALSVRPTNARRELHAAPSR